MRAEVVVVGAGIGGLAVALACARRSVLVSRTGLDAGAVAILERADRAHELGAGLQLGPNAVRVLDLLGLKSDLLALAACPQSIRVFDVAGTRPLAEMSLGAAIEQRYGHPYLTMHRADLHSILLRGVLDAGIAVSVSSEVQSLHCADTGVRLRVSGGAEVQSRAVVLCDGVWSELRQQVLASDSAMATGHLAYRAMLPMDCVPAGVARDSVSVWLGPRMHAVAYPVRAATLLNLVIIVHEADVDALAAARQHRWDIEEGDALRQLAPLVQLAPALRRLAERAPEWRLWRLHDRAPMSGPGQMARGRVALLGDAAHPMRPYMAQGAAMALEDAWVLARELNAHAKDPSAAFERYAQLRWQRAARVQHKSRLNGRIFHARGMLRLARNAALRTMGEKLLDSPWLYGHRTD